MENAFFLFRNDLRLNDNPALSSALSSHKTIPVYIFDEKYFGETKYGFPKTGDFRRQFLIESVEDLQKQLREKGSELLIFYGNTSDILNNLKSEFKANKVFFSKEITKEEIDTENEVKKYFEVESEYSSFLFEPENVPFEIKDIPDIFTQFRKKTEKLARIREIKNSNIDNLVQLEKRDFNFDTVPGSQAEFDDRTAFPFVGGAKSAWARLDHYFFKTKKIAKYKETRNGLLGQDYSSKFSPWLANGSISPVEIYHKVKEFEDKVDSNQSTYWLIFELLWRDYFKYVALKFRNKIFFESGFKNEIRKYFNSEKDINKWINYQTGNDFIDANMKEIALTGFMSNRGRQNVASYLVHDLNVSWLLGAEYFESLLIDYDPASNYGNWMYVAGVGNDPRENRKFNIDRQADMYDKKAEYRNYWLKNSNQRSLF